MRNPRGNCCQHGRSADQSRHMAMRPSGDPADARQAGFSNGILIFEGHLMIEITHYHMVRLCKLEGRQNIPDGTGFATGNTDKLILKQAIARGHTDVK